MRTVCWTRWARDLIQEALLMLLCFYVPELVWQLIDGQELQVITDSEVPVAWVVVLARSFGKK